MGQSDDCRQLSQTMVDKDEQSHALKDDARAVETSNHKEYSTQERHPSSRVGRLQAHQ